MNTTLFKLGGFKSHSSLDLDWKIDCDALSDPDIQCLAQLIRKRVIFGQVHGIPTGGTRLAEALQEYITPGKPSRLIVDDVGTTFASMEAARQSDWDIGVVIFARNEPPDWVSSIFTLGRDFPDDPT